MVWGTRVYAGLFSCYLLSFAGTPGKGGPAAPHGMEVRLCALRLQEWTQQVPKTVGKRRSRVS
jgi:hypothetical protein